jgi:hypothetical protein
VTQIIYDNKYDFLYIITDFEIKVYETNEFKCIISRKHNKTIINSYSKFEDLIILNDMRRGFILMKLI